VIVELACLAASIIATRPTPPPRSQHPQRYCAAGFLLVPAKMMEPLAP